MFVISINKLEMITEEEEEEPRRKKERKLTRAMTHLHPHPQVTLNYFTFQTNKIGKLINFMFFF